MPQEYFTSNNIQRNSQNIEAKKRESKKERRSQPFLTSDFWNFHNDK